MELNTDARSGSFVIQIRQLSLQSWSELKVLGYGLYKLYWGADGFPLTFSQLVLAHEMSVELTPAGTHTPEEGRQYVVSRLRNLEEIRRIIELGGTPSRFDWTKDQLGPVPGSLDARDQLRSRA